MVDVATVGDEVGLMYLVEFPSGEAVELAEAQLEEFAGDDIAALSEGPWLLSAFIALSDALPLRDEGGLVLSDWLLVPGETFGPQRDYLYAGDRLALQLDWSEGDSPVRQYT